MATMKTTEKRLCILGEDEIEALYGRPRFTHDERIQYFSLSPTEEAALEELHSLKSRLCFILQLGYFKARHLFFTFSLREVEEDVNYLRGQYFPDLLLTDLKIDRLLLQFNATLARDIAELMQAEMPRAAETR